MLQIQNLTGDNSGSEHKATQIGRNAFMFLFAELFPTSRTFILSMGTSYLERGCLPCSDESCRTKLLLLLLLLLL